MSVRTAAGEGDGKQGRQCFARCAASVQFLTTNHPEHLLDMAKGDVK